ncbi:TetR family transcriptional regulator [Aeromicrobium sp. SMF47]|uniref:TetR/AcrR family transcriptional regulator n=1 Tax=Aeromicrobium TaxID=2040 RepID=UPI0013C1461F|nr:MULTISPECIES: TetR/AcrR family transcriptional regulator [Aeromicrobium]MRJ75603.1 TetR family transcriptional regulator [Aeromicrobium yanjiei]MRJ99946.1 TetR family transcriptional regulator [Aeromicrobium sp. S22]
MTTRREQILDTAATLFAERGFHGVSMHDIGGACGISGPALYKHFAGKDDILTQALTSISEQLLAEGRARSRGAADASEALDALIAWHIDFALSHPALIVIQEREWANLGVEGRREVRALQLAYIDIWVDVVRRLRDDLDAAEARAAVQATFGLLNSTPHSARIGPEVMRTRLAAMARASLLA